MKKLAIISTLWCEPSSSAAGVHMLQIITAFHEQGFEITYASTAKPSNRKADLSPYQVEEVQIELNHTSFDEWIQIQHPDFVIFDRFVSEEQFGWRVREQCPHAVTILNTEDLHSLRKTRQDTINQGIEWSISFWKQAEITLREMAALHRSDCALLVSQTEIDFLIDSFGFDAEKLILHKISCQNQKNKNKHFEDRKHFYSIGNFMHEPNLDALKWLKKGIWDEIRKQIPDAEFHAYGAYPSGKAQALHAPKEGFWIKGELDDLSMLSTYRICLAPLRFGAGVKGKFLEAMQFGTPCITTTIGIESISDAISFGGLISDNEIDIAKNACDLYTDIDSWNLAQKRAFDLIKNYNLTKTNLLPQLETIKLELQIRRQHNYIGQMLLLQTTNSSKYFSKWLELKNKNQ